jgi:glucosamine--fructose-6-phosphate aminotransferase (isomerizing)
MVEIELEFHHKMIKEIREEPRAIEKLLSEGSEQIQEAADMIRSGQYEMVYIIGSGTSYHAGVAAQYAFSTLTKLITSLVPASEFPSWLPTNSSRKSLLIAVSQSGEGSDVLSAAKAALNRDMTVLAITNTPNSTLMKISHRTVLTRAGKEHAVTATKSYIAQLAALFLLSLDLATAQATKETNSQGLRRKLFMAPKMIAETIDRTDGLMQRLAHKYRNQNFSFLLGSGPNYATALEGALKLKEACNIFAEGFALREFLHGPMQLVDRKTTMFFILTEDQLNGAISEINTMRSFEASVLTISEKMDERLTDASTELVCVPQGFPKVFSPMIYIVPLQLFSYYSSVARGLNPDRPKKLTKVVK